MHVLICHDPSHRDASSLWAGQHDPSQASFSSRESNIDRDGDMHIIPHASSPARAAPMHFPQIHHRPVCTDQSFSAAGRDEETLSPLHSPLSRH